MVRNALQSNTGINIQSLKRSIPMAATEQQTRSVCSKIKKRRRSNPGNVVVKVVIERISFKQLVTLFGFV